MSTVVRVTIDEVAVMEQVLRTRGLKKFLCLVQSAIQSQCTAPETGLSTPEGEQCYVADGLLSELIDKLEDT